MAYNGLPSEPESDGKSRRPKEAHRLCPVNLHRPRLQSTPICRVQCVPHSVTHRGEVQLGESHTQSQNISANGVLFQVDSDMPVGSPVDFTISMPADVLGAESDVQIDCRGRVVRSVDEQGRRGIAVVIDEYRFERSERQ